MSNLKFTFRQLLKNAGFTAVAVLVPERTSWLLPSENAANLPVLDAHLNDDIPAAALDVFAWTIANPPANLVGARVFRGGDQALFEFDTFSSSADIGGGHGPGQRHGQFIFQDGFIQSLRHAAFRLGLRQHSLGFEELNDAAVWGDKIKERSRSDKLAHIVGGLRDSRLSFDHTANNSQTL